MATTEVIETVFEESAVYHSNAVRKSRHLQSNEQLLQIFISQTSSLGYYRTKPAGARILVLNLPDKP